MRGAAKPEAPPLGAVVVGGGPAGAGLLLAARSAGLLDALLALPIRVIERGDAVGAGELGGYAIRSDSHAESFFRAVEAAGEPPISLALETPAGQEMLRRRGGPVALSTAAALLAGACEELRGALAASGRDPFLTGLEAVSARRTARGGWRVRCRAVGGGDEIELDAQSMVLATGAQERPERLLHEVVAGGPLLPRFAGKVALSSALMSPAGAAAAVERLAGRASPKVAIVGGSHSAVACARLLLDASPGLRFEEGGVAVLHRRPLRLTYASEAAALDEGYAEFGPEDVCARTGRVFPLAGFRSDARDLLRRAWGLGGCGPEPRLRLHRLGRDPDAEAERILAEADLVVAAFGYQPRALPLFGADGGRIALHAETAAGAPLVDGQSRVLAAGGKPVEGVFGIGLAAGYPLRGTHGETSFEGQANGLSLWHGEIGAAIARDLLAARPRSIGVRAPEPAARRASGAVAAFPQWFARPPHSLAVLPAEEIAEVAASRIVAALGAALARRGRAVFVPSAGRTPRNTYALLRAFHRRSLDWSRVVCVQMDEYEGIGDRDPRGFAAELRRELVGPLGIGRFHRFHDGEGELRCPLDGYERAVRGMGGIDCAVQGIGRNGHVAFNEPGDARGGATRRVRLAHSTCKANGVLFTRGVTLGLDVLAEAKETLVLMTGAAKRDAAASVLFRAGGRENPAAAIRRCGRVLVLLDPDAAPERLLRAATAAETPIRPAPIALPPFLVTGSSGRPSPGEMLSLTTSAGAALPAPDLVERGP